MKETNSPGIAEGRSSEGILLLLDSGNEGNSAGSGQRRLLPPPRLPSILRFRSAILPSEEERNCFSLSSKAWSPEGGRAVWGILLLRPLGAGAGRGPPVRPAAGLGPEKLPPGRGPPLLPGLPD